MGHCALVAVERPDGRYDCYRQRWGGLAAFRRADPEWVTAEAVASDPIVTGDPTAVLAALDPPIDEALFVRDATGRVTTYLVCWLGLQTVAADAPSGPTPTVLVPLSDSATARDLDGVVRTLKGVLGDAVDAGLIPELLARQYLAVAVARHPAVTDEAVWLGEVTAPRQ